MRVVLDTNVLVRAAARQDGLAGKLLQQIVEGPHVLVCSLHILAEVSRVLRYPRLQARWPLGPQQIGEFITRVAAVAEVVPLSARPAEPVAADPDDDPILETAVSGRADVLCTRDQHLRSGLVVQYCARHGVQVLDDLGLHRLLTNPGTQAR